MSSQYPPQINGNSPQPHPQFHMPGRRMFDGCVGMFVAALIGLIGVIVVQSHGIQIGPSPVPTSISTTTSADISATPTQAPSTSDALGGWDVFSQGGLPPRSGTSYSVTLKAGQILMLTGGQFQLGSYFCNGRGSSTHICALIYQTTMTRTVTITALLPGNNWIGISDSLTRAEALQVQEPNFWVAGNCQTGCTSGTLYSFIDGRFTGSQTLSPGG